MTEDIPDLAELKQSMGIGNRKLTIDDETEFVHPNILTGVLGVCLLVVYTPCSTVQSVVDISVWFGLCSTASCSHCNGLVTHTVCCVVFTCTL